MWNVTELHWCSYVEIQSQSGAIVLAGSGSVFQLVSQKVAEQRSLTRRSLFINREPTRKKSEACQRVEYIYECKHCFKM